MTSITFKRLYKRLFVLSCLLSLMLMMVGAGRPTRPETQPTTDGTQPTVTNKRPVNYWRDPHPLRSLPQSEYSLNVMEQWVDLDTFVSAEMLESRFGSFKSFEFEARYRANSPPYTGTTLIEIYRDAYCYNYEKSEGGKYNIDFYIEKLQADGLVRHLDDTEDSISSSDIDPSDLRKATKPGTYWLGDIGYTYQYIKQYDPQYSNLCSIQWKSNGYVFQIATRMETIEEYTLEDGGFVAQMLREETAPQAVAQFNSDIFTALFGETIHNQNEEEPSENDRQWIVPVLIATTVVIGTAALITIFLIRRNRKRKAAAEAVPAEEPAVEKEE